jgi:5'-3' exonuclease
MGIKNFFKLYSSDLISIKLTDLKDKKIAVDALNYLYRIKSVINLNANPDNFDLIFMKSIINFIVSLKKNNVQLLFVFDGKPLDIKQNCLEQRLQQKETLRIEKSDLINVKKVLYTFGVPYIDFINKFDAEHICAQLQKFNYVDLILSNDADCFLYGASSILKSFKGGIYHKYDSNKFLNEKGEPLDRYQLIKIGVALGCDFAAKVKSIGLKTVLNKYDSIDFSEEQLKAINTFYTDISDIKRIYTKAFNNVNDFNSNDFINSIDLMLHKLDFNESAMDRIKLLYFKK